MTSRQFYDQDMSWLSFNERVLQEAADIKVPIIERIRFLGIYSSNLDEFFRVKVARIRRDKLMALAQNNETNPYKVKLVQVLDKVNVLTTKFQSITKKVFTELKRHNIHLLFSGDKYATFDAQLTVFQREWLKDYFNNKLIRKITPTIINSTVQLSTLLDDGKCYFLVALHQVESIQYALIEIPRKDTSRFIVLPCQTNVEKKYIALVDDVIHLHLNDIFARFFRYTKIEAYSIELTRDSDYHLTNEIDQSLLDKMSKGLKQRLKAEPVRLVYDNNMPGYMRAFLRKRLKIKELDHLVPDLRYRHFGDFIGFPNLGHCALENPKIKAIESQRFSISSTVFSAISTRDILLYYPYYKFSHFTEFVRQASYDPDVVQIKINIYRVSKNSPIIHSLIEAVRNGKKVTVVVELRARFDEQTNLDWATVMKDAGIQVEFGIDTLKIHSKLCLVTRKEQNELVHYAHIGTGNFHERNARIYTDFSLFTCHKAICHEVENIFTFVSHSYKQFNFNHLLVSPLNSRNRLNELIDKEISSAKLNGIAEITLKINNLVDKGLINKLYDASIAGVKIRIIVRGMCALVPNIAGVSENISIISIIDRFLEHPRVMVFANNGDELIYISSADWMERNLDQRVEVACPIYDEALKKRIIDILNIQFSDNTKARIINDVQNNCYVSTEKGQPRRSQTEIYDYLVHEENLENEKLAAICLT